jgi:hypothetical protein
MSFRVDEETPLQELSTEPGKKGIIARPHGENGAK